MTYLQRLGSRRHRLRRVGITEPVSDAEVADEGLELLWGAAAAEVGGRAQVVARTTADSRVRRAPEV